MKTRSGFVSNSSSSSFVIPLNNGQFNTVADIALYMIPKREWKDDSIVMNNIRRRLKSKVDPNCPISFRSCNYDTYIVKTVDGFFISTCNNHDWEFEVGNSPGDEDQESYILHSLAYQHRYYNASFDIIGYRYARTDKEGNYTYETCKICFGDLWILGWGNPFCPNCDKQSNLITDSFELWWSKKKLTERWNSNLSIEESFKDIAKQAWQAAKENEL
jgi:hypothetical protein